jgi:SNF2 family DNA or RNA helicase
MAGGNVNTDDGHLVRVHEAKLMALKEELELLLADDSRKVVIFARFLPEINQILELLNEMKLEHRVITGAVGQAERGEVVHEFQTDAEVRVITCQIQTAGLGITLTAADTAIFYSMDFSLANHEQAKARIHRIGQHHPVTYMYLLAENTVDEKIFEALKSKKSIADQVIDDWRSVF